MPEQFKNNSFPGSFYSDVKRTHITTNEIRRRKEKQSILLTLLSSSRTFPGLCVLAPFMQWTEKLNKSPYTIETSATNVPATMCSKNQINILMEKLNVVCWSWLHIVSLYVFSLLFFSVISLLPFFPKGIFKYHFVCIQLFVPRGFAHFLFVFFFVCAFGFTLRYTWNFTIRHYLRPQYALV